MNLYDAEIDRVAGEIVDFSRWRTRLDPIPLDGTATVGDLITQACRDHHRRRLGGHEALRWLADLAVLPPSAGGCFVAGGHYGDLAASAHSSIHAAAEAMDADLIEAVVDDRAH